MNHEKKLAEAKARLEKAKPKLKKWQQSIKDVEDPELILSGQFDELKAKRLEKHGDSDDEE
ncbi:hypothetical protein QWY82_00965 [Simiduia curdlanivorans]|uniref:Uncharacterized protein n=1 Tax=Simiduia curdlanivorans TaxID=1492769 RepID=A0ABV8V680_9GAMM|nr:hypothetical protein [Simiduia curdlanivorans]MDN3637365.1 hypothetical protein [Simiduia curdlanivorans]